jgi:hypothetical protein
MKLAGSIALLRKKAAVVESAGRQDRCRRGRESVPDSPTRPGDQGVQAIWS